MLLPSRCPVCDAPGAAPCGPCRRALRPPPALPAPAGVDRCLVLFAYEGVGRELVARLKYRNARASAAWLVAELVALLVAARGSARPVDLVTWVPTTPARRRARGFDQAELLARRVARRARLPPVALLVHRGHHQTGRSASERRASAAVDLDRRPRRAPPPGAHVLLVDDVITTGATVTAAASALRRAGAGEVSVLAVARTPLKPR